MLGAVVLLGLPSQTPKQAPVATRIASGPIVTVSGQSRRLGTRLTCLFFPGDGLWLSAVNEPNGRHQRLLQKRGEQWFDMSNIESFAHKVRIRTAAEALCFVRLRTIFDLPSSADSFRGYEILPYDQVTKQIALGDWLQYDLMHHSPFGLSKGVVTRQWFQEHALYDPIVKSMGGRWSIKRWVTKRKKDGNYVTGILSENVTMRGTYAATFTEVAQVTLPAPAWKNRSEE